MALSVGGTCLVTPSVSMFQAAFIASMHNHCFFFYKFLYFIHS